MKYEVVPNPEDDRDEEYEADEQARRRRILRSGKRFVWSAFKWVALLAGAFFAYMGYDSKNAMHMAGWCALACFFGISARIFQAEEHDTL